MSSSQVGSSWLVNETSRIITQFVKKNPTSQAEPAREFLDRHPTLNLTTLVFLLVPRLEVADLQSSKVNEKHMVILELSTCAPNINLKSHFYDLMLCVSG